MSVLDPKKTYRNLKKKGFVDSITKSKDHKRLEFFHEERLVLSTKLIITNWITGLLIPNGMLTSLFGKTKNAIRVRI